MAVTVPDTFSYFLNYLNNKFIDEEFAPKKRKKQHIKKFDILFDVNVYNSAEQRVPRQWRFRDMYHKILVCPGRIRIVLTSINCVGLKW